MSDQPISIDAQLINRVRQFLQTSGVSQRALCRELGADPGNFNAYLTGVKSLSVRKMYKLLQILNLNKIQLEAKFSKPLLSSQILALQESGRPMTLDSNGGWVPAAVDGGSDPNNSDDDEDDITETLRQVDDFHRQAREAIAGYIASVQKAKVNKTGQTEPPRRVVDPRTAGVQSDSFTAKLEQAKQVRKKAELELKAARELKAEKEATHNAGVELLRLEQTIQEKLDILNKAELRFDSKFSLAD
jgi:transcriptional regulator with XRE-family HTH domain